MRPVNANLPNLLSPGLLLFVLVIASRLPLQQTSAGIPIFNPLKPSQRIACESAYIILSVQRGGSAALDGVTIQRSQLAQRLRDRFANTTTEVLFVEADPTASFSEVVSTLDLCRASIPGIKTALFAEDMNHECPSIPSLVPKPQIDLPRYIRRMLEPS